MTTKPVTAVIFGVEGKTLTEQEYAFFQQVNPLGFILFARNCETKEQIKALVKSLHECVGRKDIPILIDQEGGRVARLKPPHWRKCPPAGDFVTIAEEQGLEAAKTAVYDNFRQIAADLYELGITVDCAPVADILVEGCHDIVGDRAYGCDPEMVAILAREVCNGLLDGGVLPIIKHIPGHGRAKADSHESLPVVHESLETMQATDFVPFKKLADMPWAMTAHIIYDCLDKNLPATLSTKAVQFIRKELGFDGVLISDDISMKALEGDFGKRTRDVISAGCDLVLHCNGNMEEMTAIAPNVPPLSKEAIARLEKGKAMVEERSKQWAVAASGQ